MFMIRKSMMRLYYSFRRNVTTQYNGEFGYELISVIPFAYWLHTQNKLKQTISCKDTRCFYYFSKDHKEKHEKRDYIIPKSYPINNIHRRFLNTTMMWTPPPYKDIFKNTTFVYSKPICVICNKYNSEWGHPPITFLSKDTLEKLFNILSPIYTIIYCRPEKESISEDNSEIYNLKEHDWIRKSYPEIKLIQDLHKKHPDYTFNELQLNIFANTNHFISVQGGYSILCSYFKGTNIIYGAKSKKKTALDIIYKVYDRWYHRFSGTKIMYRSTYNALIDTVKTSFIPK